MSSSTSSIGALASSQIAPQRLFIDGEFVDAVGAATFETLNPATNEVIAAVAAGAAEDIAQAVAAARRAFDDGPWPRLPAKRRAAVLRGIAELIRANSEELIALECLDIGMPVSQMHGLAARAADNFDYFAGVITELAGHSYRVGDEFLNYTIHKPVGVAGLIMPWNAPLMLSSWRIAPCLAAGNTIVLKPAEWAPLTSTRLAEIIAESDLPPGVFNVVHGFGETAGAALSAHPGVDLIAFTGETSTGRLIMAAGAPTLKRLSMELGGKSPVLVFDDADLPRAIDAALAQIFTMNGQRCTAGSRLIVEHTVYDEVLEAVSARAAQVRVGDPFDPATELGPLINAEHHARVCDYIASAQREGARVTAGGARPPEREQGNFLQATVIGDVREHMKVFREEIFGPVLVVTPFMDDEDALRLANATPYGLAAYVWTQDLTRAHRLAQAIDSGMCWINAQNVRDLRTPFGGVKESGIGREGGAYSFDFYCDLQTVQVALAEHPIPRLGVAAADGA
jgi:5-carboxymethyl-2-hydroxymuconic-semialdehyde dehydrogenase